MSAEIDAMTAEVAETKGIMASAEVLISGIAARIEAAGTDKAALAALVADLSAGSDALAAAVASDNPPSVG